MCVVKGFQNKLLDTYLSRQFINVDKLSDIWVEQIILIKKSAGSPQSHENVSLILLTKTQNLTDRDTVRFLAVYSGSFNNKVFFYPNEVINYSFVDTLWRPSFPFGWFMYFFLIYLFLVRMHL